MGPYKLTKSRLNKYIEFLEDGYRRGAAARAVGVTPKAVREYANANPDFAERITQAEMDACEPVEIALYTSAKEGNLGAQIFWLTNRAKGRWENTQKSKVEQSGELKFVFVEEANANTDANQDTSP